ncbi:hypothetical protein AVEN_271144-1 [Araneus ventricosus]|uniref:Uncharacterized protein n=1 Tax=Araneus ventricosus TaxID=182803 RepID=A0A4Y2E3R8_ARAVE|nr:hypothetical protein AVEN_271144-1 [Araneus ventricosus]
MELDTSCEVKLPPHFPSVFLELQRIRKHRATTLESLENDITFNKKAGIGRAVQLTQSNSSSITNVSIKEGEKGSCDDNHCGPDHHNG